MAKIKSIKSRQILDSRGNPTVETDVFLDDGARGRAAVPSGASTGTYEAVELRDGDPKIYGGQSVTRAVANVNEILAPAVIGLDAGAQEQIDQALLALDGTKDKSKLGANAILSVSLAAAVAQAQSQKIPLYQYLTTLNSSSDKTPLMPRAMFNIFNGGKHASKSVDFQEFMILPLQQTFSERLRCASEVFHALKKILLEMNLATTVGDEGGFAPKLSTNQEPLELMLQAIEQAGFKAGSEVGLGLDFASSEYFKDGKYNLACEQKSLDTESMISYIENLLAKYPIISIEDPLEQNDFVGWAELTKRVGDKVQIVGDDLYVTNTERLQKGIDLKASNAILIKPNQIGTLTETIAAIKLAQDNGMKTVVSHRSGETEDTFISDLAVGLATGQIKAGSLSRSERLAKYNQLLRIEEQLNP